MDLPIPFGPAITIMGGTPVHSASVIFFEFLMENSLIGIQLVFLFDYNILGNY